MTDNDPVALIGQIQASVDEVKAKHNETLAHLENSVNAQGSDLKDIKAMAEKSAEAVEKASARIVELEQKATDAVIKGKADVNTIGKMIVKASDYKAFASGQIKSMRVQANTITGQDGSPPSNSDTLVAPQYLDGVVPLATRNLIARDVIPSGQTDSTNAIKYPRQLSETNNAAETAEGAQKPESAVTFELITQNIATIATFLKLSKQVLDDSAFVESFIDARLRYMVNKRYDEQIIKGNGTGENISGILTSGNHTAFTPTTGENRLDNLNRMIEAVRTADYEANAIMLNPADWALIERTKVGTSDDRYVVGNPNMGTVPMLWGKPVVLSTAVTAGTAAVGAFDMAFQIFDRMGLTVDMFEQDDTNVQLNLVTVRAEMRGTLASYVPAAVQVGALII